MPHFTPSRVLMVVLSVLLINFLWSYGIPGQQAHQIPILSQEGQHLFPPSTDPSSQTAATAATDSNANYNPSPTESAVGHLATQSVSITPNTACRDVRGASDIMLVLRTSKMEVDRLPERLETLVTCAPNLAIFSDHTGTVKGIPVYDALDSISSNRTERYDEFREYKKMKADNEYIPNPDRAGELDKWKFLPMVYKAYQMAPSHKFYMFVESDTSLSWTNLLQWLDRLDYRIPYFSGAPITQSDVRIAQRGPGILLSWGAMTRYVKMYEERYAQEWESHTGKECCGEVMLANAMSESHVELVSSFPLLQGESPSTLDWTERHWCAPIVSWHRMSSEEVELLKTTQEKWTAKHGWATPYIARDAFEELVLPLLSEKKKVGWDNLSSDTIIIADPKRKEKEAKQKAEEERKKVEEEERKKVEEKERKKVEEEERKKVEEEERKKVEEEARKKAESPEVIPSPSPTPKGDTKESSQASPSPTPSPEPKLSHARRDKPTDWANIGPTIKDAGDSIENCQSVCKATQDCLQWKYTNRNQGECHLGRVIRLGKKSKEGEESWVSGWNPEKIKKVTQSWKKCDQPNWRFNQ